MGVCLGWVVECWGREGNGRRGLGIRDGSGGGGVRQKTKEEKCGGVCGERREWRACGY